MSISREVAVIGIGTTAFGENFEQGYLDMAGEAVSRAIDDAGIEPGEIGAGALGTAYAYEYTTEGNSGASLAEATGLYGIPLVRVANYCASGMEAVRYAALSIAAGECDVAIAAGVEKMRDVDPRGSLVAIHHAKGHPLYCKGRTAPGIFSLVARRCEEVHGNMRPAMTAVAVKNHEHGVHNPDAHLRKPVTSEDVESSPFTSAPLRLLDCCPTTDGAAAVILARPEVARRLGRHPAVLIAGSGTIADAGYFNAQFNGQWDLLGFSSTRKAAAMAYRQAGISDPWNEIDVAEVHDCFTITELVNYEDLGFCERGKGGELALSGETGQGGKLPVNLSGGLKSCGHPIGATGARMTVEITRHLRGAAGDRQARGARRGLAHTLGGPGSTASVMVLECAD